MTVFLLALAAAASEPESATAAARYGVELLYAHDPVFEGGAKSLSDVSKRLVRRDGRISRESLPPTARVLAAPRMTVREGREATLVSSGRPLNEVTYLHDAGSGRYELRTMEDGGEGLGVSMTLTIERDGESGPVIRVKATTRRLDASANETISVAGIDVPVGEPLVREETAGTRVRFGEASVADAIVSTEGGLIMLLTARRIDGPDEAP